ncbi:hypothetical protein ACEPAG_3183 [Sanghuangporus baumii]
MVFKKTKACSSKFDLFVDENEGIVQREAEQVLQYLGQNGRPLNTQIIELGYTQPVYIVAMMATVEETEEVAEGSAENDVGLRPPEGNIRTTLENSEPRMPAAGEQAQTVGSSRSERPSTAVDRSSGQPTSEATQGSTAQPRQVRTSVFTVPPDYHTRPRHPPSPIEHRRTPQVFFRPSRPLPRRRREPPRPTPLPEEPSQAVNSVPTAEELFQAMNSAPAAETRDEVEAEEEASVAEEEEVEKRRNEMMHPTGRLTGPTTKTLRLSIRGCLQRMEMIRMTRIGLRIIHSMDDPSFMTIPRRMRSTSVDSPVSPGLLVRDQFTQSSFPSEPSPSTTWALDEYLDDIKVHIRGSPVRNAPWRLEVPVMPVLERRHSI